MLDINLFREDKAGADALKTVRESQRRRMPHKPNEAADSVDAVLRHDRAWRDARYELDRVATERNALNKQLKQLKLDAAAAAAATKQAPHHTKDDNSSNSKDEAAIKLQKTQLETRETQLKDALAEAEASRTVALAAIGNLVHNSVPVHHDEEEGNTTERTWAPAPTTGHHHSDDDGNGLLSQRNEKHDADKNTPAATAAAAAPDGRKARSHVDLLHMIDGVEYTRGVTVAGSRGYFLKGKGVLLNLALVQYGLKFMIERGFTPVQTPFFMEKSQMAKCAQLDDFDEQLYKVSGDGEKYLIATSEQPMCVYHADEWINESELPRKFIGHSTCFRKEAGSHGRDQLGIFRVHQFEKLEQFCVTLPDDDVSYKMLEEMITNAEDFYQSLGISYRVINIASGALNDAAAKKYDLEGWFPGSKAYRELVSCSNCTDYQSRRLEARCGTKKMGDAMKRYVHMLNSTLCATSRVICCLLETYQDDTGINVPAVLQPYVGCTHIPFVRDPPKLKVPKTQKT
jgi:seryl-tRNA synthetase